MNNPKIKRNNPGNIRKTNNTWPGEVPGSSGENYKTFKNLSYGIAALRYQIEVDTKRLLTLAEFIKKFAPLGDGKNDPLVYINNVSRWSGVKPTEHLVYLTENKKNDILKAMTRQEHGVQLDDMDIVRGTNTFNQEYHGKV